MPLTFDFLGNGIEKSVVQAIILSFLFNDDRWDVITQWYHSSERT